MQARQITQTELVEALRRCRRKGGLRPVRAKTTTSVDSAEGTDS
jgi:hypothetical protein